jgi:hypothetical protein
MFNLFKKFKISFLRKKLEKLRNNEYRPILTVDKVDYGDGYIDRSRISPEYEFTEMYFEPIKALRLIIKIHKLQEEISGIKFKDFNCDTFKHKR